MSKRPRLVLIVMEMVDNRIVTFSRRMALVFESRTPAERKCGQGAVEGGSGSSQASTPSERSSPHALASHPHNLNMFVFWDAQ